MSSAESVQLLIAKRVDTEIYTSAAGTLHKFGKLVVKVNG
jgi:hypothetical protein